MPVDTATLMDSAFAEIVADLRSDLNAIGQSHRVSVDFVFDLGPGITRPMCRELITRVTHFCVERGAMGLSPLHDMSTNRLRLTLHLPLLPRRPI